MLTSRDSGEPRTWSPSTNTRDSSLARKFAPQQTRKSVPSFCISWWSLKQNLTAHPKGQHHHCTLTIPIFPNQSTTPLLMELRDRNHLQCCLLFKRSPPNEVQNYNEVLRRNRYTSVWGGSILEGNECCVCVCCVRVFFFVRADVFVCQSRGPRGLHRDHSVSLHGES